MGKQYDIITISTRFKEKKEAGALIKRKKFLETNVLSGILACCFGLYMAAVTGLSKGIYPMAVFVLMFLTGAFLIGSGVRGKPDALMNRIRWKEIAMVLLLLLHPLLAGELGFYTTAFLVITVISWMLTPKKTGKAFGFVLVYSLLVAAAAYAVFTLGLHIVTPPGILI